MPTTGPENNDSAATGRTSRRRLLVTLAAGTLGGAGSVAGRPGASGGRTSDRTVERDDRRGADDVADRPLSAGTWRLFQYEPRNTGHARSGGGPRDTAGARWGYRDGESFESTPVVTEDTVYAADAQAREVVAVDRSDGSERWRVEADVDDGNMTYADGTLFVPADDLEARSAADGSVEWSVSLGNPRSVVVRGEYAYVAASDGSYRVDRKTEAVDWHVDRVKQLAPALAVTSEYVYAAGTQYGQVLAMDPATGNRRWLRRLDGMVHGGPTVDGNRVLVPTDAELVGLAYESGVPKWSSDATVRSSVAVADGVVYATDEGEDALALDLETGEERWRRAVIPGSNPPVVVGGLLYVTGTDGSVAAISPTDGSVVWRATVGGERTANVAVAGGELYAGDTEGQLAALASGASGGLRTPTTTPEDTSRPASTTGESTPADQAGTATPTSGGAPGFGVLSTAVATGVGTLAALRRLSGRAGDGE